MLRRVQKYIRDYGLLEPDERVLVCVSGGADSVALLDVLLRGGYECVVAHCNFHLRGSESDRDEQFVRELCHRMEEQFDRTIALHVAQLDTKAYAEAHGLSVEMAARELRYRWFAELAESCACDAIAVAHHQNDQAETLLLHLMRGSGLQGLCGMRPSAPNPEAPESPVPIIRPLLCTTRDYIEHYLRDIRGLEWVTDSTNSDTGILRNAVRKWLTDSPKSTIEHLSETAERMQGYALLTEEYMLRVRSEIVREEGGRMWINLRLLLTYSAPKTLLYELLRPYGFRTVDEIYASILSGKGGKTFLSDGYRAVIKQQRLCVSSE